MTFNSFKGLIFDDEIKRIIYDNIFHYSKIKYRLYSFVIMPDHVHLIIQPNEISNGKYYSLSEIMHSIKSYSSNQIKKYLKSIITVAQTPLSVHNNIPKHIFQSESYDRIIRDEEELKEKMNYILNNPVNEGLAENGYDYRWYYYEGRKM